MESSKDAKVPRGADCVKVAVNIRPLISRELQNGCTNCITVAPGKPQVQINGSQPFTYDHVYGSCATPSSALFRDCVAPLVDAAFQGYNATLLAYGQSGSGKSYMMGTNYNKGANSGGIIPQVVETIFRKVDELKGNTKFVIHVSFFQIYMEEVFDLLAGPSRAPIQIRVSKKGINLEGLTKPEVNSKEEMTSYLDLGALARVTGSTNMNSKSSRSHAIFTILLEQKKTNHFSCNGLNSNEVSDDILSAKLHLVDLAGSESVKRTGADGLRLKEGKSINLGLLVLGKVINELGDDKNRKEGGFVSYRDSKLTQLLQDSLGGNSKTVMIACISPADTNAKTTIKTLNYANRARNIHNKAVVNRDPVAAEMQRLRSQTEQVQSELLYCRGGGIPSDELQAWMQDIECELEVIVRAHEVRSQHGRQMKVRAAMAKEVARPKEEDEKFKQKIMSECPQTMSPSARNSRISALETMLATSSSPHLSMASQLPEAVEHEHIFNESDRWNQVISLNDAKDIMNHLFDLVSSARCQLLDKEASCREKHSVIGELLDAKNLQDRNRTNAGTSESEASNTVLAATETGKKMTKKRDTSNGLCCTCSKRSKCSTTQCACRKARRPCGDACDCKVDKCNNREDGIIKKDTNDTLNTDFTLHEGGPSSSDVTVAVENQDVPKRKDGRGSVPPRSPVRVLKPSDNKENHFV